MSKLDTKIDHLKAICDRKDNLVMKTKMVTRLRESQIAKLEQRHGHDSDDIIPPCTADEEELRDEVKALRSIVDMHPEVTRFAMANLELQEENAKLFSVSLQLDNFFFSHQRFLIVAYMLEADSQIADLKGYLLDLKDQLNTALKVFQYNYISLRPFLLSSIGKALFNTGRKR